MRWVLLCSIFAVLLNAQLTDKQVHSLPPLPAIPAAGGTFVEPTFGTTLMRLTDANTCGGGSGYNNYANWQAFNLDTTMVAFRCGEYDVYVADLDPEKFAVSNVRRLVVFPSQMEREPFHWSTVNRNYLFATGPHSLVTKIRRLDVATGAITDLFDVAKDHSGYWIKELGVTDGDNRFSFTIVNTKTGAEGYGAVQIEPRKYLVWEPVPTVAACTKAGGVGGAGLSRSGNYFGAGCGDNSSGNYFITDLSTGQTVFPKANQGTHPASGFEWWVEDGDSQGPQSMYRRPYAKPDNFTTLLNLDGVYGDQHHSMLLDDASWVLHSQSRLHDPVTHRYEQEIMLAKTDGSGDVWRLAHHRTIDPSYRAIPHASISRNGRFVIFNSNWGGSGRVDAFIIKTGLRDAPAPPSPDPPTITGTITVSGALQVCTSSGKCSTANVTGAVVVK